MSAILDNASAGALNAASGLRFHTTLTMTTEFFEHCPSGEVYIEAKADKIGATVGFATATLYADETYSKPLARMMNTGKLRKPAKSRL